MLPPRDQVPEKFKDRRLNIHNPAITTMRPTPEEDVRIAEFIADKLHRAKGPVCVLLPLGGLSSIDRPGKIFYDPEFAVRAGECVIHLLAQKYGNHATPHPDR